VSLWGVRGGGTFQGVGIGGPLVGAGAHVLAIDDYVRDAEAAYSEGQRESVWEWYAHVARTRLSPGGGVVVLATPWHEDDLIGRLLRAAQTDGERFDVVRYPAIAEHDETHRREGEALHPARYDEAALDAIRRSIGSRAWAALYQCRPTPATGGLFQRAWMRTIAAVPGSPHDWEWMISVDATFKGGPGNDFVALQVWAKHRGAHRYILAHAERRRMDYPETRAAIVDLRKYLYLACHEDRLIWPDSAYGVFNLEGFTDEELAKFDCMTPTTLDFLADYDDALQPMDFFIDPSAAAYGPHPAMYKAGDNNEEPDQGAGRMYGRRSQSWISYPIPS
jgi:hypothetical protein